MSLKLVRQTVHSIEFRELMLKKGGLARAHTFGYTCGLYQQSHSESCDHNKVDGPSATKFALAAVRQWLPRPEMMERLAAKIKEKVESRPASLSSSETAISVKQGEIARLDSQIASQGVKSSRNVNRDDRI